MKVCVALALLGTLCLTGVAATLHTTTRRTLAAPEAEVQPLDPAREQDLSNALTGQDRKFTL
jgi:hypothetical protein